MYTFVINPLAVFIAGAISFLIGWWWYSPFGFLKTWVRITGMTMQRNMQRSKTARTINFFLIFLAVLLIALVSAFFQRNLFVPTLGEALMVAFWLWFVGVGISSMVTTITQPISGVSDADQWKLFAINSGYYLVVFLLSALVIFAFGS